MSNYTIYAAVFAAMLGGVSLIVSTLFFWKQMHWKQRSIRFSISVMVLFPTMLRLIYYSQGQAIPRELGFYQNIIVIITCTLLVLFAGNGNGAKETI